MTTASTSTNDHAATAPQWPPRQLSGALDTTACTTYDGALFGISAEMIKWAKDRPMSCLCRHQLQVKMSLEYRVARCPLLHHCRRAHRRSNHPPVDAQQDPSPSCGERRDRTLAFFDLPELTADEVRLFDRLENGFFVSIASSVRKMPKRRVPV